MSRVVLLESFELSKKIIVGLKVEEIHRPNQGKMISCIGVHRFR